MATRWIGAKLALAALVTMGAFVVVAKAAAPEAQTRQESIVFAAGASSARVSGSIRGDEDVDYRVSARAGQTMTVTFAPKNRSAYFNVLPPGSEEALFVGSVSGNRFVGTLPADGDYIVRVYLMRNAARRNETAAYTLDVAVTGRAATPAFDQTLELQGVRFRVSTKGAGAVVVTPTGLAADNSPMERTIDGSVTGAEVGDLNADGSPEVYVYVLAPGPDARGSLVAFAANRRRSLSDIVLPPLTATPAHANGYRGHDQFTVLEGVLGRRFPLFTSAGTRTGKMRQIQYKLVPGEASWQLRIDRVEEF